MREFKDFRSVARVRADAEDFVVMRGGTFFWYLLELSADDDANSVLLPVSVGEEVDAARE
jgi:hypothetical protein